MYAAGVTQGLMWRAFDDTGRLGVSGLRRNGHALDAHVLGPSALGGAMFVVPAWLLCLVNHGHDLEVVGPENYEEAVSMRPPPLGQRHPSRNPAPKPPQKPPRSGMAYKLGLLHYDDQLASRFGSAVHGQVDGVGHRDCGESSRRFLKSSRPSWSSRMYPPSKVSETLHPTGIGRAATFTSQEGCYNCHSQMVRPIRSAKPSATVNTASPVSSSTTTPSSGARGGSARTCNASAASTHTFGTCDTWRSRRARPRVR